MINDLITSNTGAWEKGDFFPPSVTQNGAYKGFEGRILYNHYSGADGRKNDTNDSKQPDLKLVLITKEVDSEIDDDFSDDDYELPSPQYQHQMSKPQPIRITEFHEYMKQNCHILGAEFKVRDISVCPLIVAKVSHTLIRERYFISWFSFQNNRLLHVLNLGGGIHRIT